MGYSIYKAGNLLNTADHKFIAEPLFLVGPWWAQMLGTQGRPYEDW